MGVLTELQLLLVKGRRWAHHGLILIKAIALRLLDAAPLRGPPVLLVQVLCKSCLMSGPITSHIHLTPCTM